MLIKLLLAGFILAHAGIRASYLSPRPPAREGAPAWPFELGRSWLLTPIGLGDRVARLVGIGLLALTPVGLAPGALVLVRLLPVGARDGSGSGRLTGTAGHLLPPVAGPMSGSTTAWTSTPASRTA